MREIIRSDLFIHWLNKLKDRTGKYLIAERILRLQDGNYGDSISIEDSIFELRIHYGPGYRVYFKDTGKEIIILLCGGDKSTQQADIKKAKIIAKHYKEA
jgi:putative addiction module killer protein